MKWHMSATGERALTTDSPHPPRVGQERRSRGVDTGDEGSRGEEGGRGEEKRGDTRGGVARRRRIRGNRKREGTREEIRGGEEKRSHLTSITTEPRQEPGSSRTMDSYAAIKKHVVDLYLLAWRDGCHILLSREGCLQNSVCNNSPSLKIYFWRRSEVWKDQ